MGSKRDYHTVPQVDLERFMGDWYVYAILPNPIERKAVNGIESYVLNPDGSIGITYTFRKGGVNGTEKTMRPKGRVYDTSTNAEWRVQLFKPFWSKYLIVYLDKDYLYTAVGVPNRKFLWIMSRTPEIPQSEYQRIVAHLEKDGYQTGKIIKMPQIWS
jgi:apolipoprotein D and lipocalin family protein